ncbi:hypothetical protein L1887_51757 [Cichorium endivia]|nr:hypothetical protein L1887_51757 [Cichorium endivia]
MALLLPSLARSLTHTRFRRASPARVWQQLTVGNHACERTLSRIRLGSTLSTRCITAPLRPRHLCSTASPHHRSVTLARPPLAQLWPPSLHFWRSGADRYSTSRAQLLYRAMQLRSQTLTAAICPAGPIVVFPFRAPRLGSPGLARPGLVPPTFNQINLACRFRPRARALSLSTSPLLPLTYAALRSARRRSRP